MNTLLKMLFHVSPPWTESSSSRRLSFLPFHPKFFSHLCSWTLLSLFLQLMRLPWAKYHKNKCICLPSSHTEFCFCYFLLFQCLLLHFLECPPFLFEVLPLPLWRKFVIFHTSSFLLICLGQSGLLLFHKARFHHLLLLILSLECLQV